MSLYKIANVYVEMSPRYNRTINQSKAYLTNDNVLPDLTINDNIYNVINTYHKQNPHLTIDEVEYILYGSYFYDTLLKYNGFMLHSSCVIVDNEAYLFSAPSGTGKSTHTQIYLKVFKDRAKILNDDKPAIIIENDKVFAYGTPFSGKTALNLNEHYPIKGICFIERSNYNFIEEMSSTKAIYNILNQTIRLLTEDKTDILLNYIDKVVKTIPIFRLGCNMEDDAAILSYTTMKNFKKHGN